MSTQLMADFNKLPILHVSTEPGVDEVAVYKVAQTYVNTYVDSAFEVVSAKYGFNKPMMRDLWRLIIQCKHGPLGVIRVDPQSGEIIQLTNDEIRAVREKAIIYEAREQGILPVNEDGYVVAEYARRKANGHLSHYVGLQAVASNGILVPIECPVWQFTVEMNLPKRGIVGAFGFIDVDARSGEVVPLTEKQIQRIWRRGNAAAELSSQPTAE